MATMATRQAMTTEDCCVRVSETLINRLEQGDAPWQTPRELPVNALTGNRYSGANALFLMAQDYEDPRWMTHRQAEQAGVQVRNGEHSTPILFWKYTEERSVRGKDGKPIIEKNGMPRTETVQLERPDAVIYHVFNAAQVEGLPPLEADRGQPDNSRAEKLFAVSGTKDLNALAHWTEHEAHLNRESGPLGSKEQAKEELRTAIGSMLLASKLGIEHSAGSPVAYGDEWAKILRDDPREIFRAAADAEKLTQFAMNLDQVQEKAQEKAQTVQQESGAAPEKQMPSAVQESRVYLAVPYKEKDEAKSLGAAWDRAAGSWYVTAGTETAPFTKWLPKEQEAQIAETRKEDAVEKQVRDSSRVYLAVPYSEKNAAKSVGAEWDCVAKSWYAGPKANMEKLSQWLPENVKSEQLPAMPVREEFAEALRSLGCILEEGHPILDGQRHRIQAEGDKEGARSGFYVVHTDGRPAGYIKNNRTGEELRWKSQGSFVSQQDKAVFQAACAKKLEERAQTQRDTEEKTALRVVGQLAKMKQSVPTPYLDKKGLAPRKGVFLAADGKTTCIPAQDANGKVWSMQYIQEDGTKRFAKGGHKEGCFHAVGGMDELRNAPAIVIAEGYATAGSICDAIGHATVAAFDSGNLMAVAKSLHEKYPDKAILIAGDDDQHLVNHPKVHCNPGREKAEKAAEAVDGKAVFPVFAIKEREKDLAGHTDFNDLATKSKSGIRAVARQLRPAIKQAIQEKAAELARNKQLTQSRSEGMER